MNRPALLVLGALVTLGAGCSTPDEAKQMHEMQEKTAASQGTYEALALGAESVYRVIATSSGHQAEVIHDDNDAWQPGAGADTNSAGLMAEAESLLFPLVGYRRLVVDANDPQFGLTTSGISLVVETRTAQRYQVVVGGQNLNGGGYYATVAGDPYVYLVIPQVYDYTLAISLGERVVRPPDPKFEQALAKLDETSDPESKTNPWLTQVLAEEGDR
jgi:hypothetical protein